MIYGAMIGSRFEDASFDNYRASASNEKALAACRRVASGESEGILIYGNVGVGKTHLLVALAREFDRIHSSAPQVAEQEAVDLPSLRDLMSTASSETPEGPVTLTESEMGRAARVEYWPTLDLVRALRAEIRNGDQTISDRCQDANLLIIDDFGQERATEFVLEELERIIDYRYRDHKPIAISSNLAVDQIIAKYGNRAISRWAQQCVIVEIGGRDMRVA